MSGIDGYASFTEPYLFDQVWIDGSWIDQLPVQITRAPGLFSLLTQGGTHLVQRQYRGALKPANYTALQFSLTAEACKQVGWYNLKKAYAKGAPFYFGPGIREPEFFQATSGSVYRLSRPLASGIVTGVTSVTHPTIVELNGAVDGSAATVSGQNVTANATGLICVTYSPVHLVYFTQFNETISAFNIAEAPVVLEEVLSP